MGVGSDRAKKVKAQQLWLEYEVLALRDGEAVEDFLLCLQLLVSQLVALAVAITNEKAVGKYLRVVPPKYTQIVRSMEMLIDLSTLMLEDVIGHLRAVDECVDGDDSSRRQAADDRGVDGPDVGEVVWGRLLHSRRRWQALRQGPVEEEGR
jgi:hypothetical protein